MTTTPPSAGPAEVRPELLHEHADGLRHNALIFRDLNQRSRERQLYNAALALNEAGDAITTLAARCASQERELAERDARIAELRDELVAANMPQLAVIGTVTHYDSEALLLRAEAAEQSLAAVRERVRELETAPSIGQAMTFLIGRANAIPLSGTLRNVGMRDCSAYNAYMWAIRELRSVEDELRAELAPKEPT
jgi:hypothetical protein